MSFCVRVARRYFVVRVCVGIYLLNVVFLSFPHRHTHTQKWKMKTAETGAIIPDVIAKYVTLCLDRENGLMRKAKDTTKKRKPNGNKHLRSLYQSAPTLHSWIVFCSSARAENIYEFIYMCDCQRQRHTSISACLKRARRLIITQTLKKQERDKGRRKKITKQRKLLVGTGCNNEMVVSLCVVYPIVCFCSK